MKQQQPVYIIGAGAIGRTLAVFLQHAGKDVVLLHWRHHENSGGYEHTTVELKTGEVVAADIMVDNVSNFSTLHGVVIICTKSYSNRQLAQKLKTLSGDSPLIILQNGLNVEAAFEENNFPGIYRCVLFASAQYTGDNSLRFKPAAVSRVGIIKGDLSSLHRLVEQISNPYFIFEAEKNIQPVIWTKAIVNSVFNSVCPLLETDNGIFYRNEKALNIAKRIIAECTAVAALQGIHLSDEEVLERLLLISKTSEGQLISTYQDMLNKRETEIDTLNICIARIAGKLQKQGLAKETGLLGELVQIKSEISMQ